MFGRRFWAVSRKMRRGRLCASWLVPGILLAQSGLSASPAPGTIVTTAVTASYALPDNTEETSQSNPASFVVGRASGVAVQPVSAALQTTDGQTVCAFPLQIQNTGTGSDTFAVNIIVPDGWSAALVRDDTGDGKYQDAETTAFTLPPALDAGQSVRCFLRVTCPADLDKGGTVRAEMTSQADPAQTALFTGTLEAAPALPGALPLGWRVQTGGPVLGEATLAGGIAYIGSDDGALYAIAATPEAGAAPGTVLWRRQTNGRVRCTPAVYTTPDGRRQVSAGNDAGRLTTWDAQTGQPLWSVFVGAGHVSPWRTRPLVSPGGSLVTVPGDRATLWSFATARGLIVRRAFWGDTGLAGNPAVCDGDGGAWLLGTSGWGTLVRNGLPVRRMNLGGRASGALVLDTVQNCLLGVTASGRAAAFDPASLLPPAGWPAGGVVDLGVSVMASPALDAAQGLLYIAATDHAVYAVHTADGSVELPGWPFVPPGAAGGTFRAAPLLWPSQAGGAPTLYVGDTGGGFYAVPTDHPDQALTFTPETGAPEPGEWDAAPAASGTGPEDVVVAGNSNGGVYGFCLR